jgi:hypothetical protein
VVNRFFCKAMRVLATWIIRSKTGTVRSDWEREQRGANVELAREGLMERDAVGERESAPHLACKVLERERASENGGTEGVGSAVEEQSQLPSELRYRRGNEAIEGRIRDQCMGLAGRRAERNRNGTDGCRIRFRQFSTSSLPRLENCI